MLCGVALHCSMYCGAVLECTAVWCDVVMRCIVGRCGVALHCIVARNAVRCRYGIFHHRSVTCNTIWPISCPAWPLFAEREIFMNWDVGFDKLRFGFWLNELMQSLPVLPIAPWRLENISRPLVSCWSHFAKEEILYDINFMPVFLSCSGRVFCNSKL